MNPTNTDPRRDESRVVRAPRGSRRTCRSWLTEAAYRMIQNNLDPEVAENRSRSWSTVGSAAPPATGRRSTRSWKRSEPSTTTRRCSCSRQAGRRVRDASRRAARPHRELEPRAEVGDVGALPRARPQGAVHVRPDDGRLLDLHRQPGDRAGHLRDVRRGGTAALRRELGRAVDSHGRARRDGGEPSRSPPASPAPPRSSSNATSSASISASAPGTSTSRLRTSTTR